MGCCTNLRKMFCAICILRKIRVAWYNMLNVRGYIMEKEKFNKTAYKNQFIAETYDRINLTVPKGRKQEIKEFAEANGESVNGYINRIIEENMKRCNEM